MSSSLICSDIYLSNNQIRFKLPQVLLESLGHHKSIIGPDLRQNPCDKTRSGIT
ncbi:unnamed protein product [Moneuplotes crassus]|uniref:Uncharacterized protein n=1 Tax=Euplotes crassus TaxID=5936 RepID=A0AAD1XWZ7_EUPCR|nr:unnamed protein product [Moneuplotes crassus]